MGDAENALPPSKKRAAGRELSRDAPIDDEEEDTTELEAGTFKRASDDVLATRRIVKVRRQQTNSAPSSNPFAGIRLVTPTESSAKPSEATTETQLAGKNTIADNSKGSGGSTVDSEKAIDEETKQQEVEDKTAANKDTAEESNAENGSKIGNEDQKDAAKESTSEIDKQLSNEEKNVDSNDKKENSENKDKEDNNASKEPSAEGGNIKSFQQLSSTQNAFTGFAGSGFSSSSLSFGSLSNDGSGFGSGSGSIFGIKIDKPDGSGFGSGSGPNFGLGLTNSGSSIFGTSGATAVSKSDGSRLSTLQEVVVETGEENEKVIFNADSVLFEFVDGGWKERGKGELKVNETTNETEKKARLLMRSKGNYRLILNARLYPEMKLTDMEKKGVTFACINSATEGKDSLSTFALKFKDGSIVEEFKAAIAAHKASTVLKTPENSPKASDV